MSEQDERAGAKVARGLLAGLVAGTVASLAMDGFQAAVAALSSDEGGDSEPATEQAADKVAAAAGTTIADADKPLAGQLVHYLFGAALGAAYGVAAEFRPAVTRGAGLPFALGTATLFDEAAVPAAGLGEAPWRASLGSHAYAYASHLVFGGVLEAVRRQTAGTLRA